MKITYQTHPKLYTFLRSQPDLLSFLLSARRLLYKVVFALPHRWLQQSYLSQPGVKKLHLGCGFNYYDGWLNTDLNPDTNILYQDFTKPFFFPDNSFDYIFNEHTIEHVPYQAAKAMLNEAFRVLKPGGKIRISTPDFAHLVNLYTQPLSKTQKEYLDWSANNFMPDMPEASAIHVINNFVRDWGHQFIYDEKGLKTSLELAGFTQVRRFKPGTSEDEALKNVEHHHEIVGPAFNELESLILEATKPE